MRVLFALLVAGILLLPQAASAQSASTADAAANAEAVHAAFVKLVDRGEMRAQLFGLPAEAFWRRNGGLSMALLADEAARLTPSLERVMAMFSRATGQAISLVAAGPPPSVGEDVAGIVPDADLVLVIGAREALSEIGLAGAFDLGMLARFEMGTLPFMFTFSEVAERRGIVLLADDEPARARVASFILAAVWALGGVTLGPELTGLIGRDENDAPSLTPLGEAVFALFYDEGLQNGMTIDDTVLRAKSLLID